LREIIAESGRCADTECKKSNGKKKALNHKDSQRAAKHAKANQALLSVLCGLSQRRLRLKARIDPSKVMRPFLFADPEICILCIEILNCTSVPAGGINKWASLFWTGVCLLDLPLFNQNQTEPQHK